MLNNTINNTKFVKEEFKVATTHIYSVSTVVHVMMIKNDF